MKLKYIVCYFAIFSAFSVFSQKEDYDVFIPLNSNLGFAFEETAIIRDSKEIKDRLKKANLKEFGDPSQYILIKLYAKAKGCTQPYYEINITKGKNLATVEYKTLQRGFCDKDQSLSNTILIAKYAYENDEIVITTPTEHTTTY